MGRFARRAREFGVPEKDLLIIKRARFDVIHNAKHTPDGNIYRGWAVGIQSGAKAYIMTTLVIAIQFFGPLMLGLWASHELHAMGRPVFVWEAWGHPDLNEKGELENLVCRKLLGVLFMLAIYLNAESILKKQDDDTDQLQELFAGCLDRRWMHVDAFINSWVIATSSLLLPFIFWTSEDVKDEILDAFGLLFLYTLDDYGSELYVSPVGENDFDDLMEKVQRGLGVFQEGGDPEDPENRNSSSRAFERPSAETGAEKTPLLSRKPTIGPSGNSVVFTSRLEHGDYFFSLARLVNFVAACEAVPSFLFIIWVPTEDVAGAAKGTKCGIVCSLSDQHLHGILGRVMLLGSIPIIFMLFRRVYVWVQKRWWPTDDEEVDKLNRDCTSFFHEVLDPRGQDPRLEEED